MAANDSEKGEILYKDYNAYYLKFFKIKQAIGCFFKLKSTFSKINPDLIQIHDLGMFESYRATKWAKKNNVACVLIQGTYDETRKPIQRVLEKLFNHVFGSYILKNVDAIGCKTKAAAEYLLQYNNSISPIITPIGLDVSRFSNPTEDGNSYRQKLGLNTTDKVLLYVGSVDKSRRHVDLLIDLMRILPPDYKLLIVGDGAAKAELQERSNKRVIWMGKLPQTALPDIYNIADLFLLASSYEIYGMVLLEAMYHNVPALSTPTGGALSIITENETGYIIEQNSSAEEWAEKIQSIFKDQKLYHKLKTGLKDYITSNFTWDKTCESFIYLYNTALKKHNGIS